MDRSSSGSKDSESLVKHSQTIDKTKSIVGLSTDQENEVNEKELEQVDRILINTWNKTVEHYANLTIYGESTAVQDWSSDKFWQTDGYDVSRSMYSSKKAKRKGGGPHQATSSMGGTPLNVPTSQDTHGGPIYGDEVEDVAAAPLSDWVDFDDSVGVDAPAYKYSVPVAGAAVGASTVGASTVGATVGAIAHGSTTMTSAAGMGAAAGLYWGSLGVVGGLITAKSFASGVSKSKELRDKIKQVQSHKENISEIIANIDAGKFTKDKCIYELDYLLSCYTSQYKGSQNKDGPFHYISEHFQGESGSGSTSILSFLFEEEALMVSDTDDIKNIQTYLYTNIKTDGIYEYDEYDDPEATPVYMYGVGDRPGGGGPGSGEGLLSIDDQTEIYEARTAHEGNLKGVRKAAAVVFATFGLSLGTGTAVIVGGTYATLWAKGAAITWTAAKWSTMIGGGAVAVVFLAVMFYYIAAIYRATSSLDSMEKKISERLRGSLQKKEESELNIILNGLKLSEGFKTELVEGEPPDSEESKKQIIEYIVDKSLEWINVISTKGKEVGKKSQKTLRSLGFMVAGTAGVAAIILAYAVLAKAAGGITLATTLTAAGTVGTVGTLALSYKVADVLFKKVDDQTKDDVGRRRRILLKIGVVFGLMPINFIPWAFKYSLLAGGVAFGSFIGIVFAGVIMKMINKSKIKNIKFTNVVREISDPEYAYLALSSKSYFEIKHADADPDPNTNYLYGSDGKIKYEYYFNKWFEGTTESASEQKKKIQTQYTEQFARLRGNFIGRKEPIFSDTIGDLSLILNKPEKDIALGPADDIFASISQGSKDILTDDGSKLTYSDYEDYKDKSITAELDKAKHGGVSLPRDEIRYIRQDIDKKILRIQKGYKDSIDSIKKRYDDQISKIKVKSGNARVSVLNNLETITKPTAIAEFYGDATKGLIKEIKTSGDEWYVDDKNITTGIASKITASEENLTIAGYHLFLYYYCISKKLNDKRSKLIETINTYYKNNPSVFKKKIRGFSYGFFKKFKIEMFYNVFNSKEVKGNIDIIENVRTIRDKGREEQLKIVSRGRSKSDLERLDASAKYLNDQMSKMDELKKKKKELHELKKKKLTQVKAEVNKKKTLAKEKKKLERKEKLRKDKEKRKSILEERMKLKGLASKKEGPEGSNESLILQEPVDSKTEDTKTIKEVSDEIKKEKDLIKKKSEDSIGILDRLSNVFKGIEDKDIDKKSYVPMDKSLKDLVKISRSELNELRDIEKKLTEQIKQDKLRMNQYKIFLNKQLTNKYRDLEDKEEDILHKSKLKQSSTEYLQDQLDLSVKGQLKFLEEKEKIIDTKLSREKTELDEIRNTYINKLNRAFKYEYKRMKKQYDSKLRKQRRILLEHVKDYCGDNMYIKELSDNLKKQVEIPVMVNKRRTIRKKRIHKGSKGAKGAIHKGSKQTKKKFRHPQEGVYSVIDLLSE